MMIFNLFELSQPAPPRQAGLPAGAPGQPQSLYTINNAYLLHLIICILKRLLKVAYMYKENEDSQQFIKELKNSVKEGLDYYVLSYQRGRTVPNVPPRVGSTRGTFKI